MTKGMKIKFGIQEIYKSQKSKVNPKDKIIPKSYIKPKNKIIPKDKINPKDKIVPKDENLFSEKVFPIVGIGASAGGLAAIELFLKAFPMNTKCQMAFVIVQHLDPAHKSILIDLVKQYTKKNVYIIEDGIKVKPDCVYVIPPNHDLALLNGNLHLIKRESPHGFHLPIDSFFRSLAEDQRERAICIILSGTGTDGTLGLKAIKGEGGMAIVQIPETAGYDGMPRSAIATGIVDFVLPPAEMAVQLINYVSRVFKNKLILKSATVPKTDEMLSKIFISLRNQTGHDFSNYKPNTIHRRIERRMAINQIDSINEYSVFIRHNPFEIETLFKELLIGVTNFFRDKDAFESLNRSIIPELLKNRNPESPIRVWVPGCSTGEEAYSLAILFQEQIDIVKQNYKIQIFATDIDIEAVEKARLGVYPESILMDVRMVRLAKYFTKENNTYRVNKSIRDMVVFAKQDIIKDPPFSNLDLISCRNLLIYFGAVIQKKVINLFHYALKQNAFLLLGNSESIGEFNDMFEAIDKKWKIFSRKGATLSNVSISNFVPPLFGKLKAKERTMAINKNSKTEFRNMIDEILIEDYAPPCVIINSEFEVLYVYGSTGKFLEAAKGKASLNLSRMIREDMKKEVSSGVRKVLSSNSVVRYDGLKVKNDGGTILVNLIIQPIKKTEALKGLIMILFEEVGNITLLTKTKKIDMPISDKDKIISELERDLKTRDEYLQSTVEEMETSNEELKSSNEELQSANEELQSTNEELETSREELQSVNEELLTVNTELQKKIEELSQVSNDLNNLLAGSGIGTIFVDHGLKIQRFTPAATQIINLINTDVGRPLSDIVMRFVNYSSLEEDVKTVLSNLIPKEAQVQMKNGSWFLMRIQPYRTLENVIEGAVLTFVDISEQQKIREKLKETEEKLIQIANSKQ